MGKPKKGKKTRQDDDWEEDVAADIAGLSVEQREQPEDESRNGDMDDAKIGKSNKKDKKNKKKQQQEEMKDDEKDILEETSAKSIIKKQSGLSAFQLLSMYDEEADDDEDKDQDETGEHKNLTDDLSMEHAQYKPSKNKKDKSKKKQGEEDLDAILAEIEGNSTKGENVTEKKSKRKKEKMPVLDEPEEISSPLDGVDMSNLTQDEIAKLMGDDEEDEDDNIRRKKKDKKKERKTETDVADAKDGEEEDEESTVKTAAQKKKEKKERQKRQKLQDKTKQTKGKELTEDVIITTDIAQTVDSSILVDEGVAAAIATEPSVSAISETGVQDKTGVQDNDNEEEEDDTKKKKKKEKKKKKKGEKDEEKEEKKEKKPSKMAKAIQERLKAMREEEERIKREEDEKERQFEEAMRLKEEQKQLEKEKRDQKKQKKKEKIDRQKAEGTYMTPAEKETRKRAQQMLESLKAQGIEVPEKIDTDESKKKRVVYSTRKQRKPQQTPAVVKAEVLPDRIPSPIEISKEMETKVTESSIQENSEEDEVQQEEENEGEDVKDAWDIESEDEEITTVTVETSDKKKLDEQEQDEEDGGDEEDDEDESKEESQEEDSTEESSDDDSSDDGLTLAERVRDRAQQRINKQREEAESRRSVNDLRAPVVCVLGHVDTGKTKILDKLRKTNVQDGEAGGITQQIGATNVPHEAIKEKTSMCKEFAKQELKLPGLLIIDTPGHESFSNLRSRGSSLCDIAILVVDIMHGLEPQTLESINLLKQRKTPFIVALNKIDRLYQWQSHPQSDVQNTIKKQKGHTKQEFDERTQAIIVQFAEQSLNACLYYENKNIREYVSLVPTSAHSGDGMGNLVALICELTQTMLAKRISYSENLQATVMEVKALPGLGTTIDVILVNGDLREGDAIIVAGQDGPIVTSVRGLLMPQPLRELRVKSNYEHHKYVKAAQGCKIIAKDLEKSLAGLPLYVAKKSDEVEIWSDDIAQALNDVLNSIKLQDRGVFVQASTLGSLEALLEFLKTSKIPYAGINIGPVHKRDIMKASVMLERDSQYAVILAFDVKIEREAQEMAEGLGVRIFTADIIYHLFDQFMAFRDNLKKQKQEEFKNVAVFPCKIRVLPQHIFNSRDPIVCGVSIEAGFIKSGTPICVPSKEMLNLGRVTSIEINNKQVDKATKGQEVCIKIEPIPGDAPKMFGRHFDHTDMLYSKVTRQSIDVVKEWFREEMSKADWQLMVELKKVFEIL